MKTLYLDLISGIAGDMFIAALIDLGADPSKLDRELKKLRLDGWHIHVSRQQKSSIVGIKFDVHLADNHSHLPHEDGGESHPDAAHPHSHSRDYTEIKRLISHSRLSAWVKRKSLAVFRRIAEAEGKIHGVPPEKVHFHEVGAVDSIIDIVGAAVALELLGKPRILASNVTEGTGWIRCAHGRFPIPVPATLAILGARGIAITQCDEPHELVTPTGAAILAEFVEQTGPMDNLVAEKTGFGLGTREHKTRPNILRAVLGVISKQQRPKPKESRAPQPLTCAPTTAADSGLEIDRVAVLETNLDDCSGEILGAFIEAALAAGALDVFHTPIHMKKNRPGVLLTILCAENDADRFSDMILLETTAFGVRKTTAERRKLIRASSQIATAFGKVTVKTGRLHGKVVHITPEFESAKKLAASAGVPLRRIYEAVAASLQHRPD